MSKLFTIIIPAYNEENGIAPTLDQIQKVMSSAKLQPEIIVVNDGSKDKTVEVLKDYPSIRLINHDANKGYGASLKTGILNASHEEILITDADGTYPAEDIPRVIAALEDAVMVVGARTGSSVKIPSIRKPAKWFLNQLANYLAETKIPDLNSGLRAFRKQDVLPYFNILPDGFSFTTTITLSFSVKKKKVSFISIDYRAREGKSKIRPIHDTFNFLTLIIRTVTYFNPLKVFVPLSLFFFVLSFVVLWAGHAFFDTILDATFSTLLLASLHILIVGMLADLIDKRLVLNNQ